MRKLFLLALMVPALTAGDCNGGDQPRERITPPIHEDPVAPIPEPAGAVVFAVGMVLVAAHLRKR